MPRNHETNTTKGVSLARGPALILGTVLLVAGLYFLYRLHTFPKLSAFPNGKAHVDGKAFLGIFGVNGWSGELTAAAGGVLLFGAAQHLLAKAASLIVAVVLAVVAIIALINHHSALGLFAANTWTIILWGGSALFLLINTLLPRRNKTVAEPVRHDRVVEPAGGPVVERAPRAEPGVRSDTLDTSTRGVQTDATTVIPQRGAVRITPLDDSGVPETEREL